MAWSLLRRFSHSSEKTKRILNITHGEELIVIFDQSRGSETVDMASERWLVSGDI